MLPPLIVAHKERGSPLYRLPWRLRIFQIDLLVFDRPPQPFDEDGVACPSPPVHPHEAPCCCQPPSQVVPGALGALSRVEDCR